MQEGRPLVKVQTALNGVLALRKIEETKVNGACCFRVIFLDINMPEMDGLEVSINPVKSLVC